MSPAASTRWCPTPEQVMILEEMYKAGVRTPNATQIQHITAHLSMYGKIEGKNVFYWFQNHKARDRQKLRKRLLSPNPIINHSLNHHYHHNNHHHRHHHVISSVFDHHSFQPPPLLRHLHAPPPLPPPPPPPPPQPPRCSYSSLPYYCLPAATSTPSDVFAPPQVIGTVRTQQKSTWMRHREDREGFFFNKDKPSLTEAINNSITKHNQPANEYDVDEDDYDDDNDENKDNDDGGDEEGDFNNRRPLKTLQLFPC